jgi:4'-phosphopantetheinyl transferase
LRGTKQIKVFWFFFSKKNILSSAKTQRDDPPIIVVRWMSLEPGCDPAATLWPLLDEAERSRADRFRFAADRDAYVAAHGLLRIMLSRESGAAPNNLRLRVLASGKPGVDPSQDCGDLQFSLSHTRGMVACAVARTHDVGIDVERCDPALPALDMAQRLFAPAEIERLAALPPSQQNAMFYRLWTLKEAYTKAVGQGIALPLHGFSFCLDPVSIKFSSLVADNVHAWQFSEIVADPGYCLALAVRRPVADPMTLDAASMSLRACAAYAAKRG